MARLSSNRYEILTDSIMSQLQKKGIYTDFDFMEKAVDTLVNVSGLSFKTVVDLRKEISKSVGGKIIDASKLIEEDSTKIVSTGIFSLDKLLNGGLHSKQLYEICGASSSGKTQLCLTIATNISLRTEKDVHYIDTKGYLSTIRMQTILNAQKCNDEEIGRVLNKMKITEARSIPEFFSIVHKLTKTLKNESNTRLLVIDSLAALFFLSTSKHETIYFLSNLRNMLRFIASEYNISIITTNLVTSWNEETAIFLKNGVNIKSLKPTLGKFWLRIPNTRLLIDRKENEERHVTVWKSCDLQIGTSCAIKITYDGIS
ncbi:DNA repair protein RAD51 homolog 4-like [Belonocnema kinseyi]|uniref:DNA repair protein RAD51 homolog 4-like n=1 Tax=Belonocnema kinseyi TaxID=2817044 RepID=UPI00143CDB12|nr:DNA repair protein RAD51 homolog 4-like [Belonocnema kinseyi]XP_033224741.1 DNA repair protein RAD51 homolog 4-like [Belonocnema kinseyi]